jgi:transposase
MPILPPDAPSDSPLRRCTTALWPDDHPDHLALGELLPADHLARRIEATVATLDLAPLYAAYAGTGSPPYDPALLLRAVLFATERGQHSPAAWHRAAAESGPVRWLLRGLRPARSCWYAFRDRLAPLLPALNAQPLHQAVAQGLTPATRGAGDGTIVAANASRYHLLNEARLQERVQQLAAAPAVPAAAAAPAAVAAAPTAAAAPADPAVAPTDPAAAAESAARPAWMAKRPAGRARQQRRLAQAQQEMARRQARNGGKRPSKRTARDRLVVSPADPEAAVGLDKEKVFRPLYNVQLVDDLDSPFILGYGVFAQPNDAGLLGTLLGCTQAQVGHGLQAVLVDPAYAGGADLKAAALAGVTVYAALPKEAQGRYLPRSAFTWLAGEQTYICPQGHRLEREWQGKAKRSGPEQVVVRRYRCPPVQCRACPLAAACAQRPEAGRTVSRSEHEEEVEALRARMTGEEAKALYRLRRQTVELVNADWKAHRNLRRFSGRGLERARCQVGLLVLSHNLLTLLTLGKA